jgi:hypothetical protein
MNKNNYYINNNYNNNLIIQILLYKSKNMINKF